MNQITITGWVTKDPELLQTANGIQYFKMAITCKRSTKNASGEREVDFFDVICWRGLAESCGRHLAKGDYVGVRGSMEQRRYQTADGANKVYWQLNADEIDFLRVKSFEKTEPVQAEYAEPIDNEELPF
jgi:single-strand DNA-binding protein